MTETIFCPLAAAVPGEADASVWAGVATLIGVFLGVLAAAAAYERKGKRRSHYQRTTAWMLGFAALFFASLGTAISLWSLAGNTGWLFFFLAVGGAAVFAAGIIWRKQLLRQAAKWRVIPFKEIDAEQRDRRTDEQDEKRGQ